MPGGAGMQYNVVDPGSTCFALIIIIQIDSYNLVRRYRFSLFKFKCLLTEMFLFDENMFSFTKRFSIPPWNLEYTF